MSRPQPLTEPPKEKIKVAVLGATGTVGQRFIELLAPHPYFQLHILAASSRSASRPYSEVVRWKLKTPIPESVANTIVRACPGSLEEIETDEREGEGAGWRECGVVFSGLDHDVAGPIEDALRRAEIPVFSNAKNYRRDPLVPLIVPLVNPPHFSLIPHQRRTLSLQKGYIITNANCSTTGIVVALKALEDKFGPLDTVMVTTMQAISGAGYPGVSSLDILDNVVPNIGGEEEKIEWETSKILGGVNSDLTGFDYHKNHPMKISANCNRVPVIDGHLACVSVKFSSPTKPTLPQIKEAFTSFKPYHESLPSHPTLIPSAPTPGRSIIYHEAQDRPQPRLDRDLERGACVSVGRLRECGVLDVKFVTLVDNVRLGAATSSVINAEIGVAEGWIV